MALKDVINFFSGNNSKKPNAQYGRIGSESDYIKSELLKQAQGISNANVSLKSASAIVSTVHTCLKLVSENIAKRKLLVQQNDGKTNVILKDHPLSYPLGFNPTTFLSDSVWLQNVITALLTDGNCYCLNVGDYNYQLVPSKEIEVGIVDGMLWYNAPKFYPQPLMYTEVLHFRMPVMSSDGICALSPLKAVEAEINLSVKGIKTVDNFYSNNAQSSKYLQPVVTQGQTTNPKLQEYVQEFVNNSGFMNAGRIQAIPPMYTIQEFSLDVESIQFLEACKFSTGMIAALYGVPSHLIFGGEQVGKYEEQALAFKNSLDSYAKIITDCLTFSLLSKQEKMNGISICMTENQESNLIDRANAYKTLTTIGAMTPRQVANEFKISTDPANTALDLHWLQGAMFPLEHGNPFAKTAPTAPDNNTDSNTQA